MTKITPDEKGQSVQIPMKNNTKYRVLFERKLVPWYEFPFRVRVLFGLNIGSKVFMTEWGAKRFARKAIKKHASGNMKPAYDEYEGTAEEVLDKLK